MAKKTENDCYSDTFPSRLRDLMRKNNVTQADLGVAIGVTRQAVSNYMAGISSPDWQGIAKIAKFFNVRSDYLIGLSDIATSRLDIITACEGLGLTEEAAKNISEYRYEYESKYDSESIKLLGPSFMPINNLLESDHNEYFFDVYLNVLENASYCMVLDAEKDSRHKVEEAIRDLKLSLFELQEAAIYTVKGASSYDQAMIHAVDVLGTLEARDAAEAHTNGKHQED